MSRFKPSLPLILIGVIIVAMVLAGAYFAVGGFTDERDEEFVNRTVVGDIEVALILAKDEYTVTEVVDLELQVRNTGDEAANLNFSSGQEFDFWVLDETGLEIWRWSHDKFFTMMLQELILEAGEERVYRTEWRQENNQGEEVSPGRYEIMAASTAEQLKHKVVVETIKIRDE